MGPTMNAAPRLVSHLGPALLVALAASCGADDGPAPNPSPDAATSALMPAPTGGGFCCPIAMPSCDCFGNGGWVATDELDACPRICDLGPQGAYYETDEHGCQSLQSPSSCLMDAGVAP